MFAPVPQPTSTTVTSREGGRTCADQPPHDPPPPHEPPVTLLDVGMKEELFALHGLGGL